MSKEKFSYTDLLHRDKVSFELIVILEVQVIVLIQKCSFVFHHVADC